MPPARSMLARPVFVNRPTTGPRAAPTRPTPAPIVTPRAKAITKRINAATARAREQAREKTEAKRRDRLMPELTLKEIKAGIFAAFGVKPTYTKRVLNQHVRNLGHYEDWQIEKVIAEVCVEITDRRNLNCGALQLKPDLKPR